MIYFNMTINYHLHHDSVSVFSFDVNIMRPPMAPTFVDGSEITSLSFKVNEKNHATHY